MSARPMKIPGPDHPIAIDRHAARVVVKLGGQTIADSRHVLTLREASYPAVFYFPRMDVNMSLLEPTDHASYCPYKGEASYFSLPLGGERSRNAAWSYENPHDAVAEIRGRLAFYPDRIDSMEETPIL